MATSFNTATIPNHVLEETFLGLQSEIEAVADKLCTRYDVPNISGSLPVEGSITGLGQLGEGLEEGVTLEVDEMDFTTVSYNCKRYAGLGKIADGIRSSLEQSFNYDAIERAARRARSQACVRLDNKMKSVITDTSANSETAVSNPWDGASATIVADLQSGMADIGYGDTMFLGRDIGEVLQRNDEFTARFQGFSGGSIGQGELVTALKGLFPSLENVVIGGHLYNTANPGQSVALGYVFDGVAFAAWKRDLVLCQHNETSESDRDPFSESEIVRFTRRSDIVRPHANMGNVWTGILS